MTIYHMHVPGIFHESCDEQYPEDINAWGNTPDEAIANAEMQKGYMFPDWEQDHERVQVGPRVMSFVKCQECDKNDAVKVIENETLCKGCAKTLWGE